MLDAESSIVFKKFVKSLDASSVESIYNDVAEEKIMLLKRNLPTPGSEASVVVSKV